MNLQLKKVFFLTCLHCAVWPVQAEKFRYQDNAGNIIMTNGLIKNQNYNLVSGPEKGKKRIYRYSDGAGGYLLSDGPIKNRRYKLVWRSGQQRSAGKPVKRFWQHKKKYAPLIKKAAEKVRLKPELLHAVIQAESAYNSRAKSSAGAIGLMQLMPATARRYGVSNIWDPSQNVDGGSRYLRDLLDMFENNLRLALAAYNAGEGAVQKYGNRIPPYRETQEYVRKVIKFYMVERMQNRT